VLVYRRPRGENIKIILSKGYPVEMTNFCKPPLAARRAPSWMVQRAIEVYFWPTCKVAFEFCMRLSLQTCIGLPSLRKGRSVK
jgi:hypothetical protein